MVRQYALMESLLANLHGFLHQINGNLSRPDQKFLQDALIGLLRAGCPIVWGSPNAPRRYVGMAMPPADGEGLEHGGTRGLVLVSSFEFGVLPGVVPMYIGTKPGRIFRTGRVTTISDCSSRRCGG